MRRKTRKSLKVIAVVLLLAGLALYASLPRIQRHFVCPSIAWEDSPAAFQVIGMETAGDDSPGVRLLCRWQDATVTAGRFHLTFPQSRVSGPEGKVRFASTSPLAGHDFAIHVPLPEKPRLLSAIRLQTRCYDRQTLRELGDRTLTLHYWPVEPKPEPQASVSR